MNHALDMIYKNFPNVKKRMEDPSSVVLSSEGEVVFYQLAQFVSDPKKNKKTVLNHSDAFNILNKKELRFYLDVLEYDFNPTGRIGETRTFQASEYIKQSSFYKEVVREIPNTRMHSKQYFWRYVELGTVVPTPDVVIDGQRFWHIQTVKDFIEEEKKSPLRKL
ncbi:hypothetical protein EVJ32_10980 [Exiguobacterium sp. SH5S4]|uniref:hypothetical protein n=1 Tax=Exiguobacterium sp. SH5S4 TaxID=2510961 RepID=UPI001040314B|nr:hypothetical protein [Exiguobacterium sp. SH5S4]TCI25315.1 hypothetical protein EVJ32_10980 [Exiguobacterium sp. SH5S4]